MSDHNLVACEDDSELNTVLRKFDKRQTNANQDTLRDACRAWKKDDHYTPHNRESFYKYLSDKKILPKLESAS
jgi:hypothetical protein